jgi:hypothetical protein
VKAPVLSFIEKLDYLKDIGQVIIDAEEAWSDTATEIDMKANLKVINPMGRVSIPGSMEKSTRESGVMDWKRAREFGGAFLEILILDLGKSLKLTGTAFISGKMETDTRANGWTAWSMVKVVIPFQWETCILGSITRENPMDLASINGKMVVSTWVSFVTGWSTEKESGGSEIMPKRVTTTTVSMRMIKRMAWERLLGSQAISIEVATAMTKDMVTARCTGVMAQVIKENGRREFSMELERWSFLMGEWRRVTSRTIYIRSQQLKHPNWNSSKRKKFCLIKDLDRINLARLGLDLL